MWILIKINLHSISIHHDHLNQLLPFHSSVIRCQVLEISGEMEGLQIERHQGKTIHEEKEGFKFLKQAILNFKLILIDQQMSWM